METIQIIRLSTLGHSGRMALFRLLVRRYPEYVCAGDLSSILGTKQNTMSVYLSALLRVGLIEQKREGRSLLYRVDMEGADDLTGYLFQDCCRGRPDICPPADQGTAGGADTSGSRKWNVLFICSGNSARSIFAETILRDAAGKRFEVYSAGTKPASYLNPLAVSLLKVMGHDVSALRAKHVSEFQGPDAPVMDFVFTVCDQAANEECPAWTGQPITAHWGVPDPVQAQGTVAERSLAFHQAYGVLRNRVMLFTTLRPAALDRITLQAHVDEISLHGETT